MSRPTRLLMADGKESQGGLVSHEATITLAIGPHTERSKFSVTKLGGRPMILGIPWLKRHDPYIRWSRHQITFGSEYCLSECQVQTPCTLSAPSPAELSPPKPRPRPRSPPSYPNPALDPRSRPQLLSLLQDPVPALETSRIPSAALAKSARLPIPEVCMQQTSRYYEPSTRTRSKSLPPNLHIHSPQPPTPQSHPVATPKTPAATSTAPAATPKARNRFLSPKVSRINSTAFNLCARLPGSQIYQLTTTPADTDASPKTAPTIPAEYQDYADVFSKTEAHKLPEHRPYDLSIPLQEGTAPPLLPVYNLSPLELDVLRMYIDENLRKGFIRHSQSPAGAPILFVKKADGSLRLRVDYRGINKITIKNRYPLPLIPELLNKVGKAKRFTALDMRDGYHLLRMAKGEEWKTVFRTRYGHFEYNVVPFGLCNAPAAFQHLMNDVLREYLDVFVVTYLDDVLIYSENASEHKRHVRMVLEKLRQAGLYAKPEKCQFSVEEVAFLGYLISPHGV